MYERTTPSVSFCIQVFTSSPWGLQRTIESIRALGIPEYEILVAGSTVYPPRHDVTVFDCQADLTEGRFGVIRDTLIGAASNQILLFCTPDIDFEPNFFDKLREIDPLPSFAALRIINPDGTRYWDWFASNEREANLIDYEDFHPDICFSELGYMINRDIALSLKVGNGQFSLIWQSTQSFVRLALSCGIQPTIVPQITVSHRDTEWTQDGNRVIKRIPPENLPHLVRPGINIIGTIPDTNSGRYLFSEKMMILLEEEGLRLSGNISFEIAAVCIKSPLAEIGFKMVSSTGKEEYFSLNGGNSTKKIQIEFGASYIPFQIIIEPVGAKQEGVDNRLSLSNLEINRTEQTSEKRGVNWCSHIFDYSGYASLARTLVPLVVDRDIPLDLSVLGGDEKFLTELTRHPQECSKWAAISRREITQGVGLIFYVPAHPNEHKCFSAYKTNREYLDYFIGFTMLEVDRIPLSWVTECNEMDEVWVPSQFCADIFENSGVCGEKIQKIPIGVDSAKFDPRVTPLIPKTGLFRFLSVFQWNNRKGWDVLIGAYVRAFSRNDDVELIVRAYPDRLKEPPIKERLEIELSRYGLSLETGPRIRLLEEFVPDDDMPSLYTSADCFVLPSRGEGIGLPYMEAMAAGLPVIATAWGGQLDFLTEENSYLVRVSELRPVDLHHRIENPHYQRGMQWAEPSVEHCAELMRSVFENRARARQVGLKGREDVRENWSLERTSKWMADRLSRALDRKVSRSTLTCEILRDPVDPVSSASSTRFPQPNLGKNPLQII